MIKINKSLFRLLARINRKIFPSFAHKDLNKLSRFQKIIIAYRYYITKNAL